MMGSLITRALIMVVGYVYPAYKCFKCVEMNRPDVEQLRFWCQYWIIIAVVTVLERLGDTFISWLPLYSEAKLAFIIYLWCPKTLGTTYVYSSFLRPIVATHEGDIDRNLNELTTRAGDKFAYYWQRGSVYAQSRFMEVLQYVASQAPPSRPEQGSGISQVHPQPRPPPPSPGRQEFPTDYHQPVPVTDYTPSAPVLPTEYLSQQGGSTGGADSSYQLQPLQQGYPQQIPEYLSQQGGSTGGAGSSYQMQPLQQGYPQQLPGYSQPPYRRAEQEAPSQLMSTQALPHPAAPVPTDSRSGHVSRRPRTRKQS